LFNPALHSTGISSSLRERRLLTLWICRLCIWLCRAIVFVAM